MAEDFDKIRRNVQKMVSMNAPEADIDGYLASERLSAAEFKSIATGKAKLGDVRMTQQSQEWLSKAQQASEQPPDVSSPNAVAFSQGALQGYGDEMIGGIEAAKSGFAPGAYTQARDEARKWIQANEEQASGGVKLAGNLTTGIPAALATGGTSLPAVMGVGAAEGGISAYGETTGNDMQAVKDVALGAGIGAAGGAAGYGLGKIFEKFTARGLAAGTIQKALDGNVDELIAESKRLGIAPAELDEVLREVVRGQAAKNPTAATALVPEAQSRLAAANTQTVDDVNRLVSPENASKLIADLQKKGQALGKSGYGAAYANPSTVALLPEVANNPAMADAIAAAQKLAAAQGRQFDITNLTVQDMDAMQRALSTASSRMFQSTPENTLLGPVYDDLAGSINDMAGNMAPELAETQAKYAAVKGAQEAVELGKKALDPSKEFVEVAEEFANLAPEAQEAYRAGLATRLRTLLQQKSPTANAGNVFNKEAIIEKLKAVGFPDEAIDDIIKRGQGARGVVDALQGGSDTARKLAAAKASESPLTQLTPMDVVAAGVHPASIGIFPALRAAGSAQERKAAEMVLNALTEQSGLGLSRLFRGAPQRLTPALGLAGAVGASAATPR